MQAILKGRVCTSSIDMEAPKPLLPYLTSGLRGSLSLVYMPCYYSYAVGKIKKNKKSNYKK
jgi:hypothetical protein